MFSSMMLVCPYIVSKTLKTLKSLIFSKILRPNIGLIDPGPFSVITTKFFQEDVLRYYFQ